MKILFKTLLFIITLSIFGYSVVYITSKSASKKESQKEFTQTKKVEYAFASTSEMTDEGENSYILNSFEIGTSTYIMTGSYPKPTSGIIVTSLFKVNGQNKLEHVYTSIPNNTDPIVSKDQKHIAYPIYNSLKESWVIDGVKGKEFKPVMYTDYYKDYAYSRADNIFAFSDDGKHYAHIAQTDNGIVVIKDGEVYSKEKYDSVLLLEFTPNNHLVYVVRSKSARRLYVDGKENVSCSSTKDTALTTHFYTYREINTVPIIACAVKKEDGKEAIMFNGAQYGDEYDFVDQILLSEDGKVIVFAGENDVKVIDQATSMRYIRQDEYVVINGKSILADHSTNIFMTKDGKHIAYTMMTQDGVYVVFNGKKGNTYPGRRIYPVNFSPDGTEVSYIVREMRSKNTPKDQAGNLSVLVTTSLTRDDVVSDSYSEIHGLDYSDSIYRASSSNPTYVGYVNRYVKKPEEGKSVFIIDGEEKGFATTSFASIPVINDDGQHYVYEYGFYNELNDRQYISVLMKDDKEVSRYIVDYDKPHAHDAFQSTFGDGNEFAYVGVEGEKGYVMIGHTKTETYDRIYNLMYDKEKKVFSFYGLNGTTLSYHEYAVQNN